ncbi:MAG TPA: ATPase, T2SS/T4P/T4SS family [Candidatus Eisenbacteria bacterium]|nr:ATPase, T2SS/T4P/T4SS family [Candidatus Eisenbacteria bacterium]
MAPFPHSTRTLTSILVECGIVTDEQVAQALARQRDTGLLIGETLVELGFTTEENIGWALSRQLGFPYADVHPSSVDPEMVKRFPEGLLRRIQAVPLFGTEEEITFAMADPTDVDAVAELKAAAGIPASLVIGGPASIRRVLDSVYGPPESGSPHAAPPPTSRRDIVWDRAGTNFLAYHLHAAVQARASEIHFIPAGSDLTVAYRTDAGLVTQTPEQPETSLYLRARLGVLGIPDVDDGRASSWGAAIVELGPDRVAVSACHSRTDAGVATVLRLAPAPVEAPDLSLLGLSPIGEAEIREFIDGPEGLIVVTGPPRAGGSLVLASLAALAARADRRTLVFEPAHLLPYPPGTIRIPATDAARWEQLAVGLGADVVALDGVVDGEQVETLLHGAAVGRLVFVRTDWLDPKALIAHLTRSRAGRAALRDRPFALIALPAARREGSAVWVDPSRAEIQAGSLQVTILSDEKRDALAKEGGR